MSPGASLPSTGSFALADAAALGLPALTEVLTRTEDGICVVDAGRRYVYANPAACQMLGHPAEQLRGRAAIGQTIALQAGLVMVAVAAGPEDGGMSGEP